MPHVELPQAEFKASFSQGKKERIGGVLFFFIL
jgi:hypothetical protein